MNEMTEKNANSICKTNLAINCQELCNLLLKTENLISSFKLNEILKEIPKNLLSLVKTIYSDHQELQKLFLNQTKDLSFQTKDLTSDQTHNNTPIKTKLSPKKDVILMYSGGLSSTSALWNIITRGKDPTILYIEGCFSNEIEITRRTAIKKVVLESRGDGGKPLASDVPFQTWLTSFEGPKGISKLSRKAKIAVLMATVNEAIGNSENPPSVVWGSGFELQDLFQSLSELFPKLEHIIFFKTYEESILNLAEAEVTTEKMKIFHPYQSLMQTAGPVLISNVTNFVCSCWDHNTFNCSKEASVSITSLPIVTPMQFKTRVKGSDQQNVRKPFLSMCGFCLGCERYFKGWEILRKDIPAIRIGSKNWDIKDDDRYWNLMPNYQIESRRKLELLENHKNKMGQSNQEQEEQEEDVKEEDDLNEKEQDDVDEPDDAEKEQDDPEQDEQEKDDGEDLEQEEQEDAEMEENSDYEEFMSEYQQNDDEDGQEEGNAEEEFDLEDLDMGDDEGGGGGSRRKKKRKNF